MAEFGFYSGNIQKRLTGRDVKRTRQTRSVVWKYKRLLKPTNRLLRWRVQIQRVRYKKVTNVVCIKIVTRITEHSVKQLPNFACKICTIQTVVYRTPCRCMHATCRQHPPVQCLQQASFHLLTYSFRVRFSTNSVRYCSYEMSICQCELTLGG